MHRPVFAFLALFLAGCNLDAILEQEVPPDIRLSMSVTATTLNVAPGGSTSVDAAITRLGEYTGDVSFTLAGVPLGMTASIGALTTSGKVSSATISFIAAQTLSADSYLITIKAIAGGESKTSTQVSVIVAAIPAVGVMSARQSLTVIRGGISPLGVLLTRTNFADAVMLSLTGHAGITASFPSEGISSSSATTTISVAPNVAPGSYPMVLRASGMGIATAEASFTVIVSSDPLQLIVNDVATSQASVIGSSVIVNRFGVTGGVSLSVTGLPAGISASFPDGAATGSTATARFAVEATVAPGAYSVIMRGQGTGGEAIAAFTLTIGPSNVAVSLVPQNVTLLQGTAAASVLTLVRTSFEGAVSVQLLTVPPGISVSATDPTLTGSTTTLLVTAARDVVPGSYPVGVRVVPAPTELDGPALEPITTSLTVTVVAAPTVDANVILDWSACTAPPWVAAQNGAGPWTRLTGANGRFSFSLTSVRGGVAYDDGGTGIVVRLLTSAELTSGPINFCPPSVPATHSVTAFAQHNGPLESFTWRLGGGFGISTQAAPNFTIAGVRDGTHDLIGFGTTLIAGPRYMIQRDINEPAGANIGTVALIGPLAFVPTSMPFALAGLLNERPQTTMSYLTTDACVENEMTLSSVGTMSGTLNTTIAGIPATFQRPTDFHLVTVTASSTNSLRVASLAFRQALASPRTITLPPNVQLAVSTLTGTTYRRFRAQLASIPAEYNGSVTLRYSDGSRMMSVIASAATFAAGVALLDMPELSSVPGFPSTSTVPLGSHGTFSVILDGSSGEATRCAEGGSRRSVLRTGAF